MDWPGFYRLWLGPWPSQSSAIRLYLLLDSIYLHRLGVCLSACGHADASHAAQGYLSGYQTVLYAEYQECVFVDIVLWGGFFFSGGGGFLSAVMVEKVVVNYKGRLWDTAGVRSLSGLLCVLRISVLSQLRPPQRPNMNF